jgi:hypothetical protein
MDIVLPPALFYGVGIVLIVFGALRAVFLGWKQKPPTEDRAELQGELEEAAEGGGSLQRAPRGPGYKRHLTFGALWVVLGLFLLVSTALKSG